MKRKNAILIPLSLTLSHLGEGISGIPTASGRVLIKALTLYQGTGLILNMEGKKWDV
jgi:hypothetical protein